MADIGATYDGEMAEIIKLRAELAASEKARGMMSKRIAELEGDNESLKNLDNTLVRTQGSTIKYLQKRIAESEEDLAQARLRYIGAESQAAALEQRIADAPHHHECDRHYCGGYYPERDCTCWKKA